MRVCWEQDPYSERERYAKREYEIRVYMCASECKEFRLSDFCMCDAD